MGAKKTSPNDWMDEYLEDEEIAREVESLEEEKKPEEADYDYKNKDWDDLIEEEAETLYRMEIELQHDEYIANQEDEFARLKKEEEVSSNS